MVYWKGLFIVENGISWHYRVTMRILIPAILEIVISWDFNTINLDLMVIYPLVIYSLLWKPWPIEIDDKKRCFSIGSMTREQQTWWLQQNSGITHES